jgi:hypothetical protein
MVAEFVRPAFVLRRFRKWIAVSQAVRNLYAGPGQTAAACQSPGLTGRFDQQEPAPQQTAPRFSIPMGANSTVASQSISGTLATARRMIIPHREAELSACAGALDAEAHIIVCLGLVSKPGAKRSIK